MQKRDLQQICCSSEITRSLDVLNNERETQSLLDIKNRCLSSLNFLRSQLVLQEEEEGEHPMHRQHVDGPLTHLGHHHT